MPLRNLAASRLRSTCRLLAVSLLFVTLGCGSAEPIEEPASDSDPTATPTVSTVRKELTKQQMAAIRVDVEMFCGDCHPTPRSGEFPIDAWVREVERGFEFYRDANRTDLKVPDEQLVTRFYQQTAPSMEDFVGELATAKGQAVEDPSVYFERQDGERRESTSTNWIADVHWQENFDGSSGRLLYADMKSGYIGAVDPRHPEKDPQILAGFRHASHIEPCDLDQDGQLDYLVTDMGMTDVRDAKLGTLYWVRNQGNATQFESIKLAGGLARPCDARGADFDGDGDIDIVMAEFGWQATGRTTWLENQGGESPEFIVHEIDTRHGAINTIPADMDGDGDVDFVSILGQEWETVDCYLNDGAGNFKLINLYQSPSPSYGASSLEIVDFDQDGRADLLFTNGDMFDGQIPRTNHGVHLLTNKGDLQFEHRRLAKIPGAMKALPVDWEGDGDLDIVAVAMLPNNPVIYERFAELDSISLLLNDGRGDMHKLRLETAQFSHATCATGDFDGDGKLDFATGVFGLFCRDKEAPLISFWLNRSTAASTSD